MSIAAVIREALASAWATKVTSAMTVVMVAGMVAAVLLTNGRTVGAQQAVLATLDDGGTRAVIVRAQDGAGLDASVLERLANVSSIAWIGAFGPAVDTTNSAIGGNPVSIRTGYGDDVADILPGEHPSEATFVSSAARRELGLEVPVGSLTDRDGIEYPIGGSLQVPDFLRFLEPLVVLPSPTQPDLRTDGHQSVSGEVAVLVVLAEHAAEVEDLTAIVIAALDVAEPELISVETSQQLADLRGLVDAQLAGSSRALVAGIFAITALLVGAVLYAFVMVRRRDFGRRRALGASQGFIAALVLTQVAALGLVGALLGSITAAAALALTGDPQPPTAFYMGVSILAVSCALLAAIAPAIAAAQRDPANELRVP